MFSLEQIQNHFNQLHQNRKTENLAQKKLIEHSENMLINQGIPTKKNEQWQYNNLSNYLQSKIEFVQEDDFEDFDLWWEDFQEQNNLKTLKNTQYIFTLNGQLYKSFSQSDNLIIQELNQSKKYLEQFDLPHNDKLDFFTHFSLTKGKSLCLTLKKGIANCYLIHLTNQSKISFDTIGLSELILDIEIQQGAVLNFTEISCQKEKTKHSLVSQVSLIKLQKEAKLNHYQLAQNQHMYINNQLYQVQENAQIQSYHFQKNSSFVRTFADVELKGKQAQAYFNGAYILQDDNQCDNHINIKHLNNQTISNQDFKYILKHESHGIYNGSIFIKEQLHKIKADQLNKNILLDPKTQMDSKPELYIFSNDVECSHGVANGFVDEEYLLYLTSRGIQRQDAIDFIANGTIIHIIDQMPSGAFKDKILSLYQLNNND